MNPRLLAPRPIVDVPRWGYERLFAAMLYPFFPSPSHASACHGLFDVSFPFCIPLRQLHLYRWRLF